MLIEGLNRTILLAKTQLSDDVSDEDVLCALTSTKVDLVASDECLMSHSGQCCFISAALTLARSGHSVWLRAPDVALVGPQPPLRGNLLISALRELGCDLLPGFEFEVGAADRPVDLAVVLGSSQYDGHAHQVARLGWSNWSAALSELPAAPVSATDWPIGSMAAALLASAEAFKVAMRKLGEHSRPPRWLFDQMFAASSGAQIRLAPDETPMGAALGDFDVISAGAISNAALFTLLRLPSARGHCRVLDDDDNELSNLNRNALLRRSDIEPQQSKVITLAKYAGDLVIEPWTVRYDEKVTGFEFAEKVLVGVDHIPSRWAVQRTWPAWLGVGATDTFSAYVSCHTTELPCVGCLHPEPLSDGDPIPTAAFVSFFAGLMLASYLVRHINGALDTTVEQQAYLTATRPETWSQGVVSGNAKCPVGCDFATRAIPAA